jgi:hypothetical protein
MTARASQFFFFAVAGLVALPKVATGGLVTGENYAVKFADLDGRTLATNDGHVSVVVLTTRADVEKAEVVSARIPGYCLGNPRYRMVTIVNFGNRYGGVARTIGASLMRRRINSEAAQLQRRYDVKGIHKDARHDVFVVADFDGAVTQRLGAGPNDFRVLVFDPDGKLLRQWGNVPSAPELAVVVR